MSQALFLCHCYFKISSFQLFQSSVKFLPKDCWNHQFAEWHWLFYVLSLAVADVKLNEKNYTAYISKPLHQGDRNKSGTLSFLKQVHLNPPSLCKGLQAN